MKNIIYNNIIYLYIITSLLLMFILRFNFFILLILLEILWLFLFCKCLILGVYYDYSTFFISSLLCFLIAAIELSTIIFILYNIKKTF